MAMIGLFLLAASLASAEGDGLLAHYDFDAESGDVLADRIGERHGSVDGAVWEATPRGHGLLFNGHSSQVTLAGAPLDLAQSLTIELWARHTSIEGWQDYIGNYIGGKSGIGLASNNGALYFHIGGLEPYTLETGHALQPGVWHHLAAIYDRAGGAMRIYVDGMETAAQSVAGTPAPSEGIPLYLGRYHDGRERFNGVMDELRIWSRALSEAEVMARYGEHASAFGPASIPTEPEALPEGVLMGMALEGVRAEKGLFRVATTGARFVGQGGVISCRQRIPRPRETVRVGLGEDSGQLNLVERTDFACRLQSEAIDLAFHGDSVLVIRTQAPRRITFEGLFAPEYHAEHQANHLFIDQIGGFGVYPVRRATCSTPDLSSRPWSLAYDLPAGGELWVSVFPPRPHNTKRSNESLAHEGLRAPQYWYPSDELINETARHCKVLAIHSYIFPGGERPPWMIPRFHPADIDRWHDVREKIQGHGMKVIPYFSPYYYDGSLALTEGAEEWTYFDEVRHALDVLKVDGIYFDGVSMDFRKSYHVTRKVRAMLGDDRLLYVHCSTDPLGQAGIFCPFLDAYADYTLRGEAGRGGLSRDAFLRWVVGGYNIGNAVGLWCYYGSTGESGYRNVVPTSDDIDAALRNHVRFYRPGMAWGQADSGSLDEFDREYYPRIDELRREAE